MIESSPPFSMMARARSIVDVAWKFVVKCARPRGVGVRLAGSSLDAHRIHIGWMREAPRSPLIAVRAPSLTGVSRSPRRRGKALDMAQSCGCKDLASLLEQHAALAAGLLLELHGHARTGVGVIQAVRGAIGARQSVQVGDKFRKAIDAKMAPGSQRGPVDALAQDRNPSEPLASRNEAPQTPIRRDKERNPQLRMSIQQPLHVPERATTEVAARVEFVPGRRWMNVIDAEAHRGALTGGEPPATFRERHRGHVHGGLYSGQRLPSPSRLPGTLIAVQSTASTIQTRTPSGALKWSRTPKGFYREFMVPKIQDSGTGTPRILLIGPYDPHCGEYTFLAPPLGVWRLAGVLQSAGFHAEVFDPNCCAGPPQRALERELLRVTWDVIGVSTTGMTLKFDLELAHLARRIAPGAQLVAGGMEATFRPELMFELGPFDRVVLGEGERPLLELASRLRSGQPLGGIAGIAERMADGTILKLPQRALDHAELRDAIFSTPYERMPYEAYWERLENAYRVGALPTKAAREAQLAEIRSVRLITLNYCPM
ncbi:MAG: hypothetical protein E6K52_14680, partial [Gammaproteobacteria bacterium]